MSARIPGLPCTRCARTVSLLDTVTTGELCDVCANPRPQRPHPDRVTQRHARQLREVAEGKPDPRVVFVFVERRAS